MTINKKILQIFLLSIGFLLILGTYFFYPMMKKNTFKQDIIQKESNIVSDDSKEVKGNTFENVEYKGIYDLNKEFTIRSKKAFILNEKPEIVHMTNMKVLLYMNDGRIVSITSDRGKYNKITYDSYFVDNVKATDGTTIISSKNLDLIASKDFARAYNDVVLIDDKSSLHADKVDYDFATKNYYISMFSKKKIKMKLIQ